MIFRHNTPWILLVISVMTACCTVPQNLDLRLMKEVTTNLGKNEAISPFVMSTLMSQVWLATGGDTRTEITPVLGVTQPAPGSFLTSYKSAINYLATASSHLTTEVFNRMYVKSGFTVKPTFTSFLTNYYSASVAAFTSPSQGASLINSDVAAATHNRIKDLVNPALLSNAVVVLVSALYFKGDWKHAFNPAKTETFHTHSGKKPVDMMKLDVMKLPYVNRGTYEVVSLPYTDKDYCMLLIKPVQSGKAADIALRNSLDTLDIDNIVQGLTKTKIEVTMPRFKLEADYRLKNAMQQLGINKIFGFGADLSGLSNAAGLYVSAIVHKVFIEVNEKGTEAAGAGAVIISKSLPLQFNANRPFFAVVYNIQHKINLFTAYIGSP